MLFSLKNPVNAKMAQRTLFNKFYTIVLIFLVGDIHSRSKMVESLEFAIKLHLNQFYYQREVYMPSELAHTLHPTTFISLPRDISEHPKSQKYLVVDSENEEQVSCKKQHKCKQSSHPSYVSGHQESVIMKQRGDSLINFMSFQIYPQNKSIDSQIKQTEKQISWLQKQCRLLQNMINDMAAEQAKILVEMRTKERRSTAQKQQKATNNRRNCPVHSSIDRKLQTATQKTKKSVKESVLIQQVQPQISLTTPLLTVNLNRCKPINKHDEAATVDVSKEALKLRQNSILMEQKKMSNKRKVKKIHTTAKSKQNERLSKPRKKV